MIYAKTVVTYFIWFFSSLVFCLLCLPITFLPKSVRYETRLYFFLTYLWNKILVLATFVPIKISGEENLPKYPSSPSIFVINHSSGLDIPIVEDIVGTYPHIWICKDDYGKIPLFGTLLRRMHVIVDRFSPIKAARALSKVYTLAKDKKTHIVLFPEGTRSQDGKLQPFLGGFVMLAKKLSRPVIPIAIKGAYKVMPKGATWINYSPIEVVIGKPLALNPDETEDSFVLRIESWFRGVDRL